MYCVCKESAQMPTQLTASKVTLQSLRNCQKRKLSLREVFIQGQRCQLDRRLCPYTGRTFTLELPLKLRLRKNFTNLLRIGLKVVLLYNIFIQDPKYFYVTDNPEPGHSSHRKEVDPADTSYYLIYSMFRLSLFWLNFGIFSTLAKYQIFIVYCHSILGLFLEFSLMTIWKSCIKLRGLKLKKKF